MTALVSVYIISVLLLTYVKVHRLRIFIFIAFRLKFGVKSLLAEGGGTRGTDKLRICVFYALEIVKYSVFSKPCV